MYSLFIDTHDINVIIILFKDGKTIVNRCLSSNSKHSQITLPTIRDVLFEAKLDVSELNEIIVVNGPGSFTGERIAVTIGKTIAYALNIPIKVVDSLTIKAVNLSGKKIIANEDKTGAYVASFNKDNEIIDEIRYMTKSSYIKFKEDNKVVVDVDIDYEKVYDFTRKLKCINPHDVKPLYAKGITGINDK